MICCLSNFVRTAQSLQALVHLFCHRFKTSAWISTPMCCIFFKHASFCYFSVGMRAGTWAIPRNWNRACNLWFALGFGESLDMGNTSRLAPQLMPAVCSTQLWKNRKGALTSVFPEPRGLQEVDRGVLHKCWATAHRSEGY